MLWKYGIAWIISWIIFVSIGLFGIVETKGNVKYLNTSLSFILRTILVTGIITFFIVAFLYNEIESKSKVDVEKIKIEELEYHVIDGKQGVAYVSGKICPEGYTKPSKDLCFASNALTETQEDSSLPNGCIRVNKKHVFNSSINEECTEKYPCVCIDNDAKCKNGYCKMRVKINKGILIAFCLTLVLLVYLSRKEIMLAFKLLKYKLFY